MGTLLPEDVLSAGGVLNRLVEAKAKRVGQAKVETPLSELIRNARRAAAVRRRAVLADALGSPNRTNIIAEVKHRSPSKGTIREYFNPIAIAQSYARAGAAAVSVLTEEDFFGGSLNHLTAIRQSEPELPLLRKDFLFDDYQLYESVEAGADAVLLIVAILSDRLLLRLIHLAHNLGLDVLVEVHTEEEMKRAATAGAQIIGVNNRDLTTFAVDIETSVRLARLAPPQAVLVAESGITTGSDIRRLRSAGYHAFLIGEHLIRAEDPGVALRTLLDSVENGARSA